MNNFYHNPSHPSLRWIAAFSVMAIITMLSPTSRAQNYPKKPIVVIVPATAGSAPDVRMRQVAPKMGEFLGQPLIIENRPGANGAIGAREAAKATPDGYTFLHANISNLLNDVFTSEKGTRLADDLIAIGDIESGPLIVVVNPNVQVKSLKELIELAKSKPNVLTYGSGGSGGLIQLMGERVKLAADIKILEVPYKSPGAEMPDLIAGHLDVGFGVWSVLGPLIKSGKIRALAVASTTRLPMAPEIATLAEAGLPGMETTAWNGLFAPAGTSKEVIQTLYKALVFSLSSQEVHDLFASTGSLTGGKTPEQFADFVKAEKNKWSNVVKLANIKPQ
jgi:tripartite-type tricarboxylate transporter receptor subunit TctC